MTPSLIAVSVPVAIHPISLLCADVDMRYVCPFGTRRRAFPNAGNLQNHILRRHPKPPTRPSIAAAPSREHSQVEETPHESQNGDAGPPSASDDSQTEELDARLLGSCLISDEFDDLYEAAVVAQDGCDEPQRLDSNRELLLFLARSGMPASLQQDLLDLLHHKEFDPKQVLTALLAAH